MRSMPLVVLLLGGLSLACAAGGDCAEDEVEVDGDCVAEEDLDYSAANVAACEDWVDSADCRVRDEVDCSAYDFYNCDLGGYFDCLEDHTTCDEEEGLDTSDWDQCDSYLACG